MTVKSALWSILDAMPDGTISGWKLFNAVSARTERATYPGALLAYAREYADASGSTFECVDPARSVYRFVPGVRIAGAIVDRR